MERTEKTDYRKTAAEALYEVRKTVIRMRKSKKSTAEIMEAVDFSKQAMYTAIHNYEAGGIKALRPKKRGRKTGEKRTLTHNQEKEILVLLVDKDPEQLKIRGCLWTRSSVAELIERKYGITMPVRTVGEYLRRWILTVQRPAREANQYPEQSGHMRLRSAYSICPHIRRNTTPTSTSTTT